MRVWNECGEEQGWILKDEKRTVHCDSPFLCVSWIFLSKPSHDVVFGFLLFGSGKHGFAFAVFDQFAL